MGRYIIKRLIYGFFVLIGVITVVFFLFNVLPADPARMILGQRADITSVEAINKDLGLDKPLVIQYLNYLNDLSPLSFHNTKQASSYWYFDKTKYVSGNELIKISDSFSLFLKKPYLRRSYQSKRPVIDILADAFPATVVLAITSILFAFIVGVALGVVAALKKDSFIDRFINIISVFGMSLPSFFAAILIAWLFAYVLHDFTGLNMVGSLYTVDDFGTGEHLDLKNLILPAFTLGIRPLAVISELTRSSMLDTLSQDYIKTARAKGLGFKRIVFKHVLRNSMNSVVTAISGWLASLIAGAVFVEYVFDWKGIGVTIVEALDKYDFPVLMGSILFISIILVFINIFVDIIYGWLDPRIRLS